MLRSSKLLNPKTIVKTSAVFTALVFSLSAPVLAVDFAAMFKKAGFNTKNSLSDTKIGEALKEALRVGIDKSVKLAGAKDGYFANKAIQIGTPSKVKAIEPALRKVGLGPKLDEWVLSMNRAAEKAAPHARDLFINAIMSMNIKDAEKVLNGGNAAATEYLKAKTSAQLSGIYKPVVAEAMQDYGVTQAYQGMIAKVPLAPAMKPTALEDYVTAKALDGLFYTLAEQEKAIRTDPAARVTSLLKEVFSTPTTAA